MSDDWRRNEAADQEIAAQLQAIKQRRTLEAQALKAGANGQRARDQLELRRQQSAEADALRNSRQPMRINPRVLVPLTEGSAPVPAMSLLAAVGNADELNRQWAEIRDELQASPTTSMEEARMAMRDALNAGIESGLFTQERALAIIALTGINDKPFPPEQARANVRLALEQAARANAIPARLAGEAWLQIKAQLGAEAAELDLPADAARYEELLYEVLTIRPCHLEEHVEWHLAQTICAAQRVRLSDRLLDGLALMPLMLPREAHQDLQGRTLECCQNDASQRWLETGLTDFDPEV